MAATCAGLLMLEISLTKVFSIMLWYHFGFLAVSTALLGFAASGVMLSLRDRNLTPAQADAALARAAAGAAIMTVLSLWLTTQTTFDVYSVVRDRTLGVLAALVLWVTLPFFFLGTVISLALRSFPDRVGSLYGADLIGSALGCGGAVLVLSLGFSGQHAILTSAAAMGVGALLFAGPRLLSSLVALVAVAVPAAAILGLDVQRAFPLLSPKSKPYYRVENLDAELGAKGQPTWRRGDVTLKDGSVHEIETPMPPRLSADQTHVLVETDDGPRQFPVDSIAPKKDGPGLAFQEKTWSPYRLWSSMSRVDSFHWPAVHGHWGLWGLSDRYADLRETPPRQKGITIDAWAMTSIMRYSGKPLFPAGTPEVDAERAKLRVLDYLPAGAVHRVRPQAGHVLVIGAGGGLDILTAKYFGARKITGIEINPGAVGAVRDAFPEFAGHLYDTARHPEIDVHVAEGRHFVERVGDVKYDVIQLSGVDTFSSTEAGTFALSENFLYTQEAFTTFLNHLAPSGTLTLTGWLLPWVEKDSTGKITSFLPRFSLRLFGLGYDALARAGMARPEDGLYLFASGGFVVVLIKPAGFEPAETDALDALCAQYAYQPYWHPKKAVPTITYEGQAVANPYANFVAQPDKAAFLAAYPFDVEPPTDDRPFYFEVSRFAEILQAEHYFNSLGGLTAHGILVMLLLEVALLGFVFVLWPLFRLRATHTYRGAGRVRAGLVLYFSALGFGFIAVEIVLMQKFVLLLGHPFHALAVILFSLLLFAGLGSTLSRRVPLPMLAPLLAAGLALGASFLFDEVFHAALGQSLPMRIAIAVGMLAPLGLAMGIPFPAGLRAIAKVRPDLIPWAWGINGYTSVLGSVAAVILGMEFGFMTVLWIAAGIYALGVIGYALMNVGPRPDAASPEA